MNAIGDKVYLTSSDLRRKVTLALSGKLRHDFNFHIPDSEYYLTPMEDVKRLVERDKIDRREYASEVGDCDDFAFLLKAAFIRHAWDEGKRRAPHSVGIIWGMLPHGHAINWVLTRQEGLYFIEPQTDEIFKPRKTDKDIWMMMA